MLVVNLQKFQIMFLGCPSKVMQAKIYENMVLETSDSVKQLGIILENKFSFNAHITKLSQTASKISGAFAESEIFYPTIQ